MAQNRKNGPKAGDATGRAKAALEAEQNEVALRRQEEITMINQATAAEAINGIFDPNSGDLLVAEDIGEDVEVPAPQEVLDFGVQTAETDEVVIRVNETLTNVTIGAGTFYNFEEGKQYKVSRNVAAHLEEKGYVWH